MDGKTYDRAAVNLRDAKNLATAFFPLASLDEASIQEMSGYDDRNFYLETVLETDSPKTKRPFTLKVTNRKESKDVALLDAQNDLMLYLRSGGFPAPQPIQTRDGSLKVLHPIAHPDCSEGDPKYAIRLLTFLAGELLAKVERTDSMLRHVGEFIGKMSIHLKVLYKSGRQAGKREGRQTDGRTDREWTNRLIQMDKQINKWTDRQLNNTEYKCCYSTCQYTKIYYY
jgi:Ser/Thr protein kinase RdoA (MazF antagonist)